MENREILRYCIDEMKKAGAEKAQCLLKDVEKEELNVEFGEIDLLRTTYDTNLNLTAILDNKKGTVSINQMDKDSIDEAIEHVMEIAKSSESDEANDIAPEQPSKSFSAGPESPDLDLMYDKTKDFLAYTSEKYPITNMRGVNFDFNKTRRYYMNSNGVDFKATKNHYTFVLIFSSREGKSISSFNYSAYTMKDIDKALKDYGSIDTLLQQSTEQIKTHGLPEKFVGDVIVTPDCLGNFVGAISSFLGDYSLIAETSIYQDKLNKPIADPKLTLHSKPISDEIATPYFFTSDGFEAENSTIIDDGALKTFLLSLYGANKTGKERAVNRGGCYVIEPGDAAFDDIVKSTKQGILLCRFSGGRPSKNGDFSGVAKNSYYIEDGEIKFPLSETMITGNLKEMLFNIKNISKEQIDFGFSIYPWIQFSELTVSGK